MGEVLSKYPRVTLEAFHAFRDEHPRFYFVAEMLSNSDRPERRAGSDKPIVLGLKLDYYRGHEHCRGILIPRQDRIEADLHVRTGDGWRCVELRAADDRIVIPDFGDIGPLGDLYRHTPLFSNTG